MIVNWSINHKTWNVLKLNSDINKMNDPVIHTNMWLLSQPLKKKRHNEENFIFYSRLSHTEYIRLTIMLFPNKDAYYKRMKDIENVTTSYIVMGCSKEEWSMTKKEIREWWTTRQLDIISAK